MILPLLLKLFGPALAPVIEPFAKIGLVVLGLFLIHQHGIGEGKDKIRRQIAEKVAEAKAAEQERFLNRMAINEASYRTALIEVASVRQEAPQIIREIRNAPATLCSHEPVGVERVRLLNAAITGNRNEDPAAGFATHRTGAGPRNLSG